MMKKIKGFLCGFIAINILWFIASILLNTRALPNPIIVYKSFNIVIHKGILSHVAISLYRIFAGVGISLLIGIPIGYFMAKSKVVANILHPIIYFSYSIPKTALLPIAMLLLGLGDTSKVLIMFLTMVFQVIITTRDAIFYIPESIYHVGKSTGKSEWFLLRYVTFPAILPEIFTGIRINLGTALAILLIVEAYGTRLGIGYYILDSWSRMNYNEMYAGIIVISLLGAILFLCMDILIEKICKWKKQVQ